jgi:hypothetical protein
MLPGFLLLRRDGRDGRDGRREEVNKPKSNSPIILPYSCHNSVVAMSRSDVSQDIDMELPLVLFRVSSHVFCINEVPSYFVIGEGFGKTYSIIPGFCIDFRGRRRRGKGTYSGQLAHTPLYR